ncbi:hypothetical protein AMTRI_Chr11g93810 [Amborella trichopoda]
MCLNEEESNPHLFLHCSQAFELWSLILQLFRIQWVLPSSVKALISSYSGCHWPKAGRTLWKSTIATTIWVIWLDRNKRVFQGHKNEVPVLFHKVTTHKDFVGIPTNTFLSQWENIFHLQPHKNQRTHNWQSPSRKCH